MGFCFYSPKLYTGYAELCDRSYGNVTYLGSHDSFAYSTNLLACESGLTLSY